MRRRPLIFFGAVVTDGLLELALQAAGMLQAEAEQTSKT